MTGYVVMSKNKSTQYVEAICVCTDEKKAKILAEKRNEKYKDKYCWYEKVDIV